MITGVLCAVRGATETAVVQAIASSGGRLEVTRRCADLAEVLAAAAAGLGGVAVVSTDLPGLDREAVRHLHGSGAWVVLVAELRGGSTLSPEAMGADAVVASGSSGTVGQVIADLLDEADRTGLRPGSHGQGSHGQGGHGRGAGEEALAPDGGQRGDGIGGRSRDGARAHVERSAPEPGESPGSADGRVVAVWGPTGAPGRSTLALNVAAELARAPEGAPGDVLLVDADTYGGTLAQRLGLLDEAPGLAAAARLASTGRLDVQALAALSPALDGGPRVLTGITRADRWPEIAASSLDLVWACARALARWTVVDCAFGLEEDEALSYDTRAPRRNAATLAALAEADAVVVVGTGDPIGLQRLVRGLGDVADTGVPASACMVVVNRVRASASGPRPGQAIREALHRYAGVERVHLVPEDTPTCDGALMAARTLVEHAPAAPVRRAIGDVAAALVARSAPVGAH